MITRELIDFLITSGCGAAVSAGREIMDIYNSSEEFDVNINTNNTVVTKADKIAHESIKKSLSPTRIPIMSEEGRNILFEERYSWDLYWLVDPLDGTREFVNKNDEFVISIALMQDNRPLFGVIYIPTENSLYFSDPDRGAFKVDQCALGEQPSSIQQLFKCSHKLQARTAEVDDSSKPTKVVVTRSHMNEQTDKILEQIKIKCPNAEVIHCGSSKKFCMLAEGTADIYFRTTPLYDWDIAAGEAISTAVGINTCSFERSSLLYNKEDLIIGPFITSIKDFNFDHI